MEENAGKNLDPELSDIVANSNCPYLALALQEVFQAAFHNQSTEKSQPDLLLPHSRPDPLVPLEPVLKRGLAPNIQVPIWTNLFVDFLHFYLFATGTIFNILSYPC